LHAKYRPKRVKSLRVQNQPLSIAAGVKTLLLFLCLLITAAYAEAPWRFDTIRLPAGYTLRHNQGTDSYVGASQQNLKP